MNSSINILKFIFIALILGLHSNMSFGGNRFMGSYVYVDWFFIFSGFTLARSVDKIDNNDGVFLNSCIVMKKKMGSILPYYLLSCTIALIIKIYFHMIDFSDSYVYHRILYEYLMLQMLPIYPLPLTDISWFLSALWMSFLILIPLSVRFRRHFFRFSIIIFITIFYYFYVKYGNIYNPVEWTPFGYKGLIRAIADISLGLFAYELTYIFKYISRFRKTVSLFVIIGYALIIYYVYKVDESIWYFYIPVFFAILISLQMSLEKFAFIPDNLFTRFLGKMSMLLFMNHQYIFYMVEFTYPSYTFIEKLKISLTYIFIICIFILIIIDGTRYIKNKFLRREI